MSFPNVCYNKVASLFYFITLHPTSENNADNNYIALKSSPKEKGITKGQKDVLANFLTTCGMNKTLK